MDYYDFEGNPITQEEWVRAWIDYKTGQNNGLVTKVDNAIVSTIWLGLDHRPATQTGPPLIYETLVFGGALHDEMYRYATLDDAKTGHERMVERVKAEKGE